MDSCDRGSERTAYARRDKKPPTAGKSMTSTPRGVELGRELLAGGSRYAREGNVVTDLTFLLAEIGIDPSEIEREHPSGSGWIDVYIPRHRTIIEVKARGKAADPDVKQPGQDESPRQQLERYMGEEIAADRERPLLAGVSPSPRKWTGIVTDGRSWHVYSYPNAVNPIEHREVLHSGPIPGGATDLVAELSRWLSGDPVGRPWIPTELESLFGDAAEDLTVLYGEMPDDVRRETETKRALWHDMLRGSGMSPKGEAAPEHLFVTHSFLITTARMVAHSTVRRTDDWKPSLMDGFAAWILAWPRATMWAAKLWAIVSRYDWRQRRGDVLRPLYESFVPSTARKVFGEFYTPDWLAAMIVEEALDDDWLERTIQRADDAVQNRTSLEGVGVLDPSCGSGTFLYHAAIRMLDAPAMKDLWPTQKADVVTLLLNGIDVHPVAVEIAKANLMRVLPAEPSAGESALRIHLGDSLLESVDPDSLFGHIEGSMRLVSPKGREILIPVEFVRQDGFGDSMRRLVEAARSGSPVPLAALNKVPESRRPALKQAKDDLADTIREEGNSVWTWYAINIAGPHLLAERKVDRIVANPPWVKLSSIQEVQRKRAMEALGRRLGLQEGGKQSPHLDIAAFFVLQARELYMNRPDSDPAIWLVKKSAINAGHWGPFRQRHEKTLAQSLDLEELQPFGGGDARRCCLLMECRSLRSTEAKRLEARLSRGSKKPKPKESWSAVRARVRCVAVPDSLPRAPSEYGSRAFRQGATIVPHVLLVAERTHPQARGVRVRTRESMHPPWRDVASQEIEVPKRWLSKLYGSPDMLPFVASLDDTQAIIPVNEDGGLDLDSAPEEFAWQHLDDVYRSFRGKGKRTPKTLAEQIDYGRKLSAQPQRRARDRRMVLYPKAGHIMRAARTRPGSGFVSHTLYWHVTAAESEAGYLTALLNAPCLRRAFFESRRSGRDFELHPWRRVPIPRYNGNDDRHTKLAKLCGRAERAALRVAQDVRLNHPSAKQQKLSRAIRDHLAVSSIFPAIDRIAAQLLPDQAVISPRAS